MGFTLDLHTLQIANLSVFFTTDMFVFAGMFLHALCMYPVGNRTSSLNWQA